jgi:hypothetical protein
MPGSLWFQRRGDFADFADSHDIAEQGLNVELRQLSRSSSSWETATEGCIQKLSILPGAPTGKEPKSKSYYIFHDFYKLCLMQQLGSPLSGSSLWRQVAAAFAFARPDIPRSLPQLQPEDFSEAYKLGYERFQYPSCMLVIK